MAGDNCHLRIRSVGGYVVLYLSLICNQLQISLYMGKKLHCQFCIAIPWTLNICYILFCYTFYFICICKLEHCNITISQTSNSSIQNDGFVCYREGQNYISQIAVTEGLWHGKQCIAPSPAISYVTYSSYFVSVLNPLFYPVLFRGNHHCHYNLHHFLISKLILSSCYSPITSSTDDFFDWVSVKQKTNAVPYGFKRTIHTNVFW